ncbi:hypothetical protein V8C26DRAFT_49890 [Trichoderma gracile]
MDRRGSLRWGEKSHGSARRASAKALAKHVRARLDAALWQPGAQTLTDTEHQARRRALYRLAPQRSTPPSPALSGLSRDRTRSPKQHLAASKPPPSPSFTRLASDRVESPRIASFHHFTVCFTSEPSALEPVRGQGGASTPASLGRAMPSPNWCSNKGATSHQHPADDFCVWQHADHDPSPEQSLRLLIPDRKR